MTQPALNGVGRGHLVSQVLDIFHNYSKTGTKVGAKPPPLGDIWEEHPVIANGDFDAL